MKKVIDTLRHWCYIYIRSLRVIEMTDRKASAATQKGERKNNLKKFLTEKAKHDILSELRLTSQDKALWQWNSNATLKIPKKKFQRTKQT